MASDVGRYVPETHKERIRHNSFDTNKLQLSKENTFQSRK